ncbi:BNR repeat-containing protein [Ensifer adhaerens]|uniref:BNR-4 repeat-containing protein n=1 Tax=Ensifer adhaerens TaxID=106592 RepID=UPI001CBCBD18|nr:BNR-4 repeat-containing protein [Ensifer adhaerens]UAX95097.1 BNR repeat-containing protein [Ensifer adhaerens]UAY03011.1 BNR repeat-containing protein [Ensifer adhaerens]UAY10996.1 BNR repeat-containing protein [Ensifer adhaerens]
MKSGKFLVPRSSRSLGSVWAGNSVNCVPYRRAFVSDDAYRYLCYFSGEGHIKVTRQRLSDGELHSVQVRTELRPYDAHQSVAMGVDEDGKLHLAFGAHVSALWGASSKSDRFEDGFLPPRVLLTEATYPMFLNDLDGQLLLLYRKGPHFDGELLVSRFDVVSQSWRNDMLPIASGRGSQWTSGPYVNTPAQGSDGVVHLFLVWRQYVEATSAGDAVNVGIDYVRSRDGCRSIETLRGIKLSKPLTQTNAERVVPVPIGANLMNQSSSGIMPGNHPAAMTYWDDEDGIPQYRLCRHDGRSWQISVASDFKTPFRVAGGGTLPLPHSRPEFVAFVGGILIIYRSVERNNNLVCRLLRAPDFALEESTEQVLVNQDLGHYEPVVDKDAWYRRGELVVYVQPCQQQMGADGSTFVSTSRAKLMSWTPRRKAGDNQVVL